MVSIAVAVVVYTLAFQTLPAYSALISSGPGLISEQINWCACLEIGVRRRKLPW